MKSLFYGGAVAAVSGLLLGAGLKAPLAVDDFEPMHEIAGFETAEVSGYDAAPQYVAPTYYMPVVQVHPTATVDEVARAELAPAVYTTGVDDDATGDGAVYRLAAAEPAGSAPELIRRAEPIEAPTVVGASQGFEMVEAPAAEMF